MIRHSNERSNIQLNFATLKNAINSQEFPQLFDHLVPGYKTIIHCSTIDHVLRIFVRMYHSLCSDRYNAETLHLLETDLWCEIVIAIVAFANGINVQTLIIAILLGFPDTMNEMVQRIRRIRGIQSMLSHVYVLIQPRQVTAAQKQLDGTTWESAALKKNHSKKKLPKPMELSKVHVLTTMLDDGCIIASLNREYNNPPHDTALLDCHEAQHQYYCSNCLHSSIREASPKVHSKQSLNFWISSARSLGALFYPMHLPFSISLLSYRLFPKKMAESRLKRKCIGRQQADAWDSDANDFDNPMMDITSDTDDDIHSSFPPLSL
ncbi:hypothetical protein BDZ89DRAFT_1140066 [Hymenopellis radicata]|nr:hypothetical protein BDZ89DRAFT_1140066 [Hymenopellis radicata]